MIKYNILENFYFINVFTKIVFQEVCLRIQNGSKQLKLKPFLFKF